MSFIQRSLRLGAISGRIGYLVAFSILLLGCTRLLATQAADEAEPFDHLLGRVISPTGLRELMDAALVPFVLVDADASPSQIKPESRQVRHIYYSRLPGVRAASESVLRDRRSAAGKGDPRYFSQRLSGTPIEWQEHGIDVLLGVSLRAPVSLGLGRFIETIEDKVDMQIVDLRGEVFSGTDTPVPGIRRLLPHEIDGARHGDLAKRRWIILLDDGNGAAQEIAQRLYVDGYRLVAFLEGGYPALNRFVSR